MVAFLEQRRVAIVGNRDGERAASLGFAQAGQRERRRAAGGDRNQSVRRGNRGLPDDGVRLAGLVFGIFHRAQQRVLAASHQ